jgi:hypothetical protein
VAVLTSPDGLDADDLRFTSGTRLTPVFGMNVGNRRHGSDLPAIGTPEHTALMSGSIDLADIARAAHATGPLVGFAPIVLDPDGPGQDDLWSDPAPGSGPADGIGGTQVLPSRRSLRAAQARPVGRPLSDDLVSARGGLPTPRAGALGSTAVLPPRVSPTPGTGVLRMREVEQALADQAARPAEDPTPTGELARPFVKESQLCDWDADAVPPPVSVDVFQRAVRAGMVPEEVARLTAAGKSLDEVTRSRAVRTRRELRARERATSPARSVTVRRLAKGGVLAITALGVVSSATPHTLDAFGLPKDAANATRQSINFADALAPNVKLPERSAQQIAAAQQAALRRLLRTELADQAVDEASSAVLSAGGVMAGIALDNDAAEAAARQAALDRAIRDAARDPQAVAAVMVAQRGWAPQQFQCLNLLWKRESNWNYQATNASSGAYGLAQALPGKKMASVAADWRTNPVTQIQWGLNYIADRYGTPCGAWGHSQAYGWY